jgi:trans-2-enoyl-CoA reductase
MPLACRLLEFGASPATLEIQELPSSPPGSGEVVLRMLAASVNPADINVIEGNYGELPALPATIGNEGCGIISQIGPNVKGLEVGAPAIVLRSGTWTTEMRVSASEVVPLPLGIDPWQGAMLSVNPATAWRMLHDFTDLQCGDWIVQNASNSAVGRAVIQLAHALGLRTLNVVRRPELIDELRGIGADIVVLEDVDLRSEAVHLCGGSKPRLALNAVGGSSALNIANALAPGFPHVTYGAMGRQPLKIPNGLLIFKNISFHGFWLRRWREAASLQEIHDTYRVLSEFVVSGVLKTPVHRIFPLTQVVEAVNEASLAGRSGKVLLDLGDCKTH